MTFTPTYRNESILWWKRGERPLAVPKCGFTGLQCPLDFFQAYKGWIIAAGVTFLAIIAAAFAGMVYFMRYPINYPLRLLVTRLP
ncbi:hypothetical protein COOONC_23204 [Cooperia oncophora]